MTADRQMPGARERVGYYDALRVAAMIGVILIHVCAQSATRLAADGQALGVGWHVANLLDSLGRFAVPAYLMITGGLLLDGQPSLRTVYRKRIPRVAVPLLFWTVVYLVLQAVMVEGYDWKSAIGGLVGNPAEIHLWYLYALIAVYLLLPFLQLLVHHAPRPLLWYGIALWLVFSCLWRAAAGLIPALELPAYANLDLLGGYLGYVMLGWLLSTQERLPGKGACVAAAVIGVVITAAGTWLMTWRAGELNAVFYQYFMPNVILAAAGIFCLFRRKVRGSCAWLRRLSGLSFGVYLVHEVFLRLLNPLFEPMLGAKGAGMQIAGMLLLCAAVLLLSIAAAWLLSALPGIRFLALGERRRK